MGNRREERALSQAVSTILLTVLQMQLKVPHCSWEEFGRGSGGKCALSPVFPVKQIGHKRNYLLLSGFLGCKRKAHLSQFGNETQISLRASLLISRKTQESVGNHLFLELYTQFTLLVHQEDVWIISTLQKGRRETTETAICKSPCPTSYRNNLDNDAWYQKEGA